jgi:DNA-binding MarR family transcriptional regulator
MQGVARVVAEAEEPDYAALVSLRTGLQQLDSFSEQLCRRHGCTASMFQLMLAVKTGRQGKGLDIGMLATSLRVRHPSAAAMVRKAEACGFLETAVDPDDGRRVLVRLTDGGEETVEALASAHAGELRRLRSGFVAVLHSH